MMDLGQKVKSWSLAAYSLNIKKGLRSPLYWSIISRKVAYMEDVYMHLYGA